MSAPYQLFGVLPTHIEDALRESIRRFGVLVPITVDQDGNILDGHHRQRLAEELRAPYDRIVRHVTDADEAREIAHTLNADRRQLTEEQRREVAVSLREAGHSFRAIAGALGVSKDTVARDLEIVAPETIPERVVRQGGGTYPARRPQVFTRTNQEQERAQDVLTVVGDIAPAKTLDLRRAERIAREHRANELRAQPLEQAVTGDVEIRHGDFRDVLQDIPEGTVDAIITDPPYPRDYWHLYEHLGALARRILNPNGVLAVMTGTRLEMLDHVDALIGRHMRRRHRAVYLTPGPRWRDNTERVATGYKPILIYAHPRATDPTWIQDDVFTSAADDKKHHHWGQSETGIGQLVERLTQPGALVVDPFLGGGTTAVVSRDLGRRFLGCDADAGAVLTSRERIA